MVREAGVMGVEAREEVREVAARGGAMEAARGVVVTVVAVMAAVGMVEVVVVLLYH